MAAEPAPGAPAPRLPLPDLAWITGLVLAWLYAAGWSYAYRWYARFDLGLNGLDLPVETVLMYGYWVLRSHWVLLLPALAVWPLWTLVPPTVRRRGVYGLPLVLILLFALAYTLGARAADDRFVAHRDHGFRCLPRARVGLVPQADRGPAIAALAAGLARESPPPGTPDPSPDAEWRLLVQTASLLVLIKPEPQGPPVVALVPWENLDVARLSPVVGGCE
ncbi:hypothetical protein [Candidatus Thiodictyon syntrophicum]|jgi:hypothetical protein|uniref:Uncharacterized protein n=1 Tax=Candidatus Thiodictyon syntrophicum TaxID=1166950 RepID=A0A2K8UDD2_9GAMM|nr:hypothetical protein [Candidatus Thiodictyon syntrophicum]AUB83608.1 hypothetical protein THSYN_23430 [Candidatus Thiodictyon syntrophicum]